MSDVVSTRCKGCLGHLVFDDVGCSHIYWSETEKGAKLPGYPTCQWFRSVLSSELIAILYNLKSGYGKGGKQ